MAAAVVLHQPAKCPGYYSEDAVFVIHPSVKNTRKSAPETLRYQQNQRPWQPCSLELRVRVNHGPTNKNSVNEKPLIELSKFGAQIEQTLSSIVQHFQWVTFEICLNSFRIDFVLVKKSLKFNFCQVQLSSQKPTQITNLKKSNHRNILHKNTHA